MHKLFIVFAFLLASALADIRIPRDVKKEDQNKFKYRIKDPGILTANARGNLYDDGTSRLDGSASLYKNFVDNKDPMKIGGGLKYNHLPSNLGAVLNLQNTENRGTKVGAELTRTLMKDRFTNIEGGLNYRQTFGTPFGNSEPYFGGFIRGRF